MCRSWPAVLLLAACGRVGFEPRDLEQRYVLRLDRYDPGEVLTEFPVTVVLDEQQIDLDALAPDGSDLRAFDASGTPLPLELVRTTRPWILFVLVPRIEGTTTTIELRYGDATAPVPAAPVFGDAYELVLHLETDLRDATGRHVVEPIGTVAGAGFSGGGRAFAGREALRVPDAPTLGFDQITLSAFARIDRLDAGEDWATVISRELADGFSDDFLLGVYQTVPQFAITTDQPPIVASAGTLGFGTWHHFAMTYDATRLRGLIDGVVIGELAASGRVSHTAAPIFIGANRDNRDTTNRRDVPDADFVVGAIDEVMIERVARSPAWIRARTISLSNNWITYSPATP